MKVIEGGFPKQEDSKDQVTDMLVALAEMTQELTEAGLAMEAVVVIKTEDGVTVAASKQEAATITYILNLGLHATLSTGFITEEDDDGTVH
jgi:D-serine dehydratase